MKGLKKIPNQQDLLIAYNELEQGSLTEKKMLRYFQWVRFDPRLGEIIVKKLLSDWRLLNPFSLYSELQTSTWPSVMGVILDMVEVNIKKVDSKAFGAWKACVTYKIKKEKFQQFYIGLTAFAGKKVNDQLENSNKIFKRWNFYGTNLLYNKEKKQNFNKSFLNKDQRIKILNQFIQNQTQPFSVGDYLRVLPLPTSRRVAEKDLKDHPKLKGKGFTKNKVYQKL